MSFTLEELQVLRFVLVAATNGRSTQHAVEHPAWKTLITKVQALKPEQDPQRVENEVSVRARLLRGGYTEAEVERIIPILRNKNGEK